MDLGLKRPLGISVLEAARRRISAAFDHAEHVCVSFSAGKDSTVMLHLVAQEARRRGQRFSLLLIDLEAQYTLTIEHARRCFDLYADIADPYWIALPLSLRNAVSQFEPQWMCWDPARERDWVRRPPSIAITDESRWTWFHRGMEFEEFVPAFAEWLADGRDTVSFVGIRTQESLNRWRTITSQTKSRVHTWPWTTRTGPKTWNAYPIYDWRTEDIWTWAARNPSAPMNGIYELMHKAGLTIHQARICQPYGDDQRRGLWLYHLLEPETWGRIVARVNGANQGSLYARETGNIMGVGRVTCPEGHTWQSYAELLLSSMPAPTQAHYRNKIDVFLTWWHRRGYEDGIPDEADRQLESARKVPSWRRICKALLRNDYWCKGLSFSQHKSSASLARYNKIMAGKRHRGSPAERWQRQCGPDLPGKPTAKQLAMICALTGGTVVNHAWRVIGNSMGISTSKAIRTATRQDASACIDVLKASQHTSAEPGNPRDPFVNATTQEL